MGNMFMNLLLLRHFVQSTARKGMKGLEAYLYARSGNSEIVGRDWTGDGASKDLP